MKTDQNLHLLWEQMREGHSTKASWYPDPCPAMVGEDDSAYGNRLTGYTSHVTGIDQCPYDHRRYRECSLGYHLTGSCRHGDSDCECPCHAEPHPIVELLPIDGGGFEKAADVFASMYYLPRLTSWQVMFDSAEAIRRRSVTNQDDLRIALSKRWRSPIGPWFAQDVVSVLAKYAPDVPTIKTGDGNEHDEQH